MTKENGNLDSSKSSDQCLKKLHISEEYILHSAVNELPQAKLAVSLSSNAILLYDVESQAKVITYKSHQSTVTGIKFSKKSPELLFSSSLDGKILVWDFRQGVQPVQSYYDDCDAEIKPITCFDYNFDEQYISGGTEVIREDSFIIFWDRRKTKHLGAYWNSHYDEITQVQFHLKETASFASSSVDGIINLFDLYQECEDDALCDTLNVGPSVNRFCLSSSDSVVSCIRSTEEYQLWPIAEAKPTVVMSNKQISEDFMCNVDYLIDTFEVDDSIYLAAGSNDGSMQLYSCGTKGLKLIRELNGGHTDVIRTVSCSREGKYFITGGEDGVLCTWENTL